MTKTIAMDRAADIRNLAAKHLLQMACQGGNADVDASRVVNLIAAAACAGQAAMDIEAGMPDCADYYAQGVTASLSGDLSYAHNVLNLYREDLGTTFGPGN